jgi:hypothetical protein
VGNRKGGGEGSGTVFAGVSLASVGHDVLAHFLCARECRLVTEFATSPGADDD